MNRSHVILFVVLLVVNIAVALTLVPAASAQTSGGCTAYHTVQRGDTLFSIARRYGTTMQEIQSFNGIANPNRIYVGQSLCVWHNGQNPVPQPSDGSYTVQRGDTLFSIARRYGMHVTQLASFNGIWDPNRIYVGQVLRIPAAHQPQTPIPPVLHADNLSIIESHNVNRMGESYVITNDQPFYIDVAAPGATGVAFYLQDSWNGVVLLGEDTNGADGWGMPARIPQPSFAGQLYAVAYNAQGQVAHSKFVSVWR